MTPFTVLQWNILAESLATPELLPDVNPELLKGDLRREQIIGDLHAIRADIVCIQELDFYDVMTEALPWYTGVFIKRFNDVNIDGCAILYTDRFTLVQNLSHVISDDRSQVVAMVKLKDIETGAVFTVASAHLKAKSEFSHVRHVQMTKVAKRHPDLLCIDMNAPPREVAYQLCASQMSNAFPTNENTSFKTRHGVKSVSTIDYIFYRRDEGLHCIKTSRSPIMMTGHPTHHFPSDHAWLLSTFRHVE